MILPPFPHQPGDAKALKKLKRSFDASDPGTGKTRTAIMYRQLIKLGRKKKRKVLVFAPKSTLQSAWGNDLNKYAPELTYVICPAEKRAERFAQEVDIYITNHDAVKWVEKNLDLSKFFMVIIDEVTAFKHRTSQRSKAMGKIIHHFERRHAMSGTLNGNTITDVWYPTFLMDDGERLGNNFWKFRNAVCTPVQNGRGAKMVKWVDKEGAEDAVGDILRDMTVRHTFAECHPHIPPPEERQITFDLSPKHQELYDEFRENAVIELQSGKVTAIHAGIVANKLLQIASGAVYDGEHITHRVADERNELIMELCAARRQCLVSFSWTHQRDALVALAKKRKWDYGVIDGSQTGDDRTKTIEDFQAGKLKVIFAHPQSAAHGITLTAGAATIWASPIYDAELFLQFNKRLFRAGQDKLIEQIMVSANNTLEGEVYSRLAKKVLKVDDLLAILTGVPI
jgi:SNF2 family DNA or RNA helicase